MEINDHGLFWWAGSEHTDGYAAGLLTINSSGVISLELHQTLPGRSGAEAVFREEVASEVGIVGCLKATGHYVLLRGLQTNGGRSGLISYENFIAEECFICQEMIDTEKFTKLKISLEGLQEWIRPGKIDCEEPLNNKISIGLECNPTEAWETNTGLVEIRHHFTGNKPNLFSSDLNIGLASELIYTPTSALSSQEIVGWYRAVQDLLLILTNCTLTLKWPKLIWSCEGKDLVVRYYFRRQEPADNKITWQQTLLPFPRIREAFGTMVDKWLLARKSLGPGISLYLGTRRNFRLYAEHRFVNLVWGLEALGRRTDLPESDDSKVSEKVKRITEAISSVEGLNSGDRNWLKNLMKRAVERPLSERLFETLSPVAIGISEENLKKFCKTCADLRNDLSHHGGEREPGEYEAFLTGILNNSEALSKLYLLVILSLLGVGGDEFERIMYMDIGSNSFKVSFRQAGLIPEEDIEQLLASLSPQALITESKPESGIESEPTLESQAGRAI
ncbi:MULTISPECIES: HEPN domain-containing protein [unclassified Pseudomonas]|uniref:ApeA N-terminal domain 1-containing protein n=1 Tax=unclassified Pseudomonas TaxID=196821 RepID=UPI001CC047EC|nr:MULTISPECIES: HEPN domain-containing protein [unclassified Pseudomonas]